MFVAIIDLYYKCITAETIQAKNQKINLTNLCLYYMVDLNHDISMLA